MHSEKESKPLVADFFVRGNLFLCFHCSQSVIAHIKVYEQTSRCVPMGDQKVLLSCRHQGSRKEDWKTEGKEEDKKATEKCK